MQEAKTRVKSKLPLSKQSKVIIEKWYVKQFFDDYWRMIDHIIIWVTVSFINSTDCTIFTSPQWRLRPAVVLRQRHQYSSARWARTKPASGKTSGDTAKLVSTWKSFCITCSKHRGIIQRQKLMQMWKMINENPKLQWCFAFKFWFLHA